MLSLVKNLYSQISIDEFIKYAEHGDNNYKGYAKKNDKKNGINGLVKNWRRPIYPILALASYIFFIHRVTNL